MGRKILLFSLALILLNSLYAQNRTISGTVTDQQAKRPLRGATVVLRSATDPSFSRNTVSDSTGSFGFSNLRPDSFALSISFVGYNPINRRLRIDSTDISIDIAAVPNSSS